MCHSATARSTHGVVVDRAVFVTWNPPTTTRSRTRTGFVFCFSHFAVRDVLQYQRRPRRSPRRPLPESSAVSAVQLSSPEPEASLPDLPTKLILRVPASPPPGPPIAFASAVVRRLGQGRPPVPPGRPPSCFIECVPARVVRRPCQGRPPSSFYESVVRRPRQFYESVWSLSSAVPVTVVRRPRQGHLPSSFYECLESAVPSGSSAIPARVARCFCESQLVLRVSVVQGRPHQGRPPSSLCKCQKVPSPPGAQAVLASSSAVPARFARQARFASVSSAVPVRVVRRPCQGRPPSSFCQCQSAVRQGRQARLRVSGVCRPPSKSGSSAVPDKVARQALFGSRPRQNRPPSPPVSPAKLN